MKECDNREGHTELVSHQNVARVADDEKVRHR